VRLLVGCSMLAPEKEASWPVPHELHQSLGDSIPSRRLKRFTGENSLEVGQRLGKPRPLGLFNLLLPELKTYTTHEYHNSILCQPFFL
jgi:hypothetical protein